MRGAAKSGETGGPVSPDRDGVVRKLANEVRNPLAIVIGYAEIVRIRGDDSTRIEAADRIVAAAEQLSAIVDDLLTLFALESGAVPFDPVRVELAAAVTATVGALAPERPLHVFLSDRDGDEAWPCVEADPEHLSRILKNVLVAVSSSSRVGSEVHIAARRAGRLVEVSVSTFSSELTSEELETLLERGGLLELADGSELPLTGFELYEARGLVELHGGTVAVTGDGAARTVTFTLPVPEAS